MVLGGPLDVTTYVQKASVGPGNQAAIAFCAAIESLQKRRANPIPTRQGYFLSP